MKTSTSFFQNLKLSISSRIHALSPKEKKIFGALAFIVIFGIIGFINYESSRFSVQVPTRGGTLTEGILGTPRFINPVLANSDIDQDISSLIYSGLVRRVSAGNTSEPAIIPDLAESYTVSDDGKEYIFNLRKNASFHDGKPVKAEDIIFTIKTIQDTQFQSPLLENWLGINVEAIDDLTVKITLPRPFSGFLDSATVGILPKHIWGTLTPDEFLASNYNTSPNGSGPYKIKNIHRDVNGIADTYTFGAFGKFSLGKPYIPKIIISLYPNEQDLLQGYEQDDFNLLANIRPYEISTDNSRFTVEAPLPRMFGLFLNTEKNELFKDESLRNVINSVIDPSEIISSVFQGFAQPINHPLPELAQDSASTKLSIDTTATKLDGMGWKLNETTGIREKGGKTFSFTISTADTPELKYTAQIIQKQLRSIGINTELQIFQLNDLENSVIKKRSFDSLLFGQFVRNDADLYAFWHSSQKDVSGLNITGYSSKNIDTLIEKLFSTNDETIRTATLSSLKDELSNAPVIWLYQPDFVYALHRPVYGININNLISKHDRFANIYQWYVQTDTVWKMFKN